MVANVVLPSNDFSNLAPAHDLVPHGRHDHRRHRGDLVPAVTSFDVAPTGG
jgi:hypothetical protein